MATIWEEIKNQGSKMKGRPLKEKIAYFWEYYSLITLGIVCAVALIVALVHTTLSAKKDALCILMINSLGESFTEVIDGYNSDLTELLDFDQKKYGITIDDTLAIGTENVTADIEYSTVQKIAAMISSKSADIIIANSAIFEQYSQNEYMIDLREIYSQEELAALSDIIYYTDASTYGDYELSDSTKSGADKQREYIIDHHDSSLMKDPIPCGFYLDEASPIKQAYLYDHFLSEEYQGYTEQGIIGIVVNTPRPESAKICANYFTGR